VVKIANHEIVTAVWASFLVLATISLQKKVAKKKKGGGVNMFAPINKQEISMTISVRVHYSLTSHLTSTRW